MDYIGVSKNLDDALSSYRSDDVKNAMLDLDNLRSQLTAAHAAVMKMMKGIKQGTGNLKAEFDALVDNLKTEDQWFAYRSVAREFISIYCALSPDQSVLDYTKDLKWVASFLRYGTQVFEKKEAFDQKEYSKKIREMLEEHLDATGLSVTVKLRSITDPDFWEEFDVEGMSEDDIQTAAIRKSTELRKTVYEKLDENPHQFGKFSDRLKELLERLDDAQLSWADKLKMAEELAKDIAEESRAHEGSGLSEQAYGFMKVLEALIQDALDADALNELALSITELYEGLPSHWEEKTELRKTLRQQVRKLLNGMGLKGAILKSAPDEIEEFALKAFAT